MKPLLITAWSGSMHAEMAVHTVPRMIRYAQRHGFDFGGAGFDAAGVPASWFKVPMIARELRALRPAVIWIDCDVVIADGSQNILDAVPAGKAMALVAHWTECGFVPNCGVWVCREAALDVLDAAWAAVDRFKDHPWWEQAAVMEQMGYVAHLPGGWPSSEDTGETEARRKTHFLDPKWNDHPNDSRHVADPLFVHCTGYDDRLEVVRRVCAAS